MGGLVIGGHSGVHLAILRSGLTAGYCNPGSDGNSLGRNVPK